MGEGAGAGRPSAVVKPPVQAQPGHAGCAPVACMAASRSPPAAPAQMARTLEQPMSPASTKQHMTGACSCWPHLRHGTRKATAEHALEGRDVIGVIHHLQVDH